MTSVVTWFLHSRCSFSLFFLLSFFSFFFFYFFFSPTHLHHHHHSHHHLSHTRMQSVYKHLFSGELLPPFSFRRDRRKLCGCLALAPRRIRRGARGASLGVNRSWYPFLRYSATYNLGREAKIEPIRGGERAFSFPASGQLLHQQVVC